MFAYAVMTDVGDGIFRAKFRSNVYAEAVHYAAKLRAMGFFRSVGIKSEKWL